MGLEHEDYELTEGDTITAKRYERRPEPESEQEYPSAEEIERRRGALKNRGLYILSPMASMWRCMSLIVWQTLRGIWRRH